VSVRFGTDGIRGVAGRDLTIELAHALGRAIARELRPDVVILGRDTRESGPMLADALAAGLCREAVSVIDADVITTPGISYLAFKHGVPGVMISASHNPYQDNGIKVLSRAGSKLDESTEHAIEATLGYLLDHPETPEASAQRGEVRHERGLVDEYVAYLVASTKSASRDIAVVLDCANGAAFEIAPRVLRAIGIEPVVLFADPNGQNINDGCGSTHPDALGRAVLEHGAELGICFDGDADRMLAIDENGELVDGDALMALFALDLKARGVLVNQAIAVTVMSNLGLHHALREAGIRAYETPVGDKYVVEAMHAKGLVLGGEQSGHIVFGERARTGDGILTALRLLELLTARSEPLSMLAKSAMTRFPQELRSVRVRDRHELEGATAIWELVRAAEQRLGENGRVLLRASGTESLIRVMVEAADADEAKEIADHLAKSVENTLGAPIG
jgi:phosphoglucosamine mutase